MRHSEPPRSGFVLLLGALVQTVGIGAARAENLPVVNDVDLQPLAAQILRVVEALDILGQPLAPADKAKIDKAIDSTDQKAGVQTLQEVVDRHCLIGIDINPESRVKAAQGPAAPRLVQNGWTVFLVKVHNEAGVTAELEATSPNAEPIYKQSTSSAEPKKSIRSTEITERWMDLAMFRNSRKSAEWCLKSVDQCWSQKERAIRPSEKEEARKAYDLARRAYRKIREESADD
jgi:hypothetical protein